MRLLIVCGHVHVVSRNLQESSLDTTELSLYNQPDVVTPKFIIALNARETGAAYVVRQELGGALR